METQIVPSNPAQRHLEELPERVRVGITGAVVAVLHVAGFGLVGFAAVSGSGNIIAAGVALSAYLAGVKHFADADHLCAIDNATRKFVGEQRRPTSVGLAFALGHSTVVLVMALALIAATSSASNLLSEGNTTSSALGVFGGTIAGSFLVLIGLVNLAGIVSRRHHAGSGPAQGTTTVMSRLMAAPLQRVRRPWHMYVVGLLFGLGFDTATLIGLLVLTATSAASGVAVIYVVALPLCFAAGMTLGDAVNGYLMMRMYASATQPRRLRFDIVVTVMSIVSGMGVGTLILVATAHETFGLTDPVTTGLASIDLEYAGFGLMAAFALVALAFAARARSV